LRCAFAVDKVQAMQIVQRVLNDRYTGNIKNTSAFLHKSCVTVLQRLQGHSGPQ
jgi:hypothetical protein